ncbi:hypothetical protein JCM24511_05022 [Saitozyma sp. JCM 24511]|nr:hypothetical protein JCM24511_05022 [Saitozyma sp. JCM 24511]
MSPAAMTEVSTNITNGSVPQHAASSAVPNEVSGAVEDSSPLVRWAGQVGRIAGTSDRMSPRSRVL